MSTTKTIVLCGVGGQGTLLASRVLGNLLMDAGLDVKMSEVLGMSQRGGSVITYIRYGDRVYSPIVNEGEADYIVAFELCEAARWINHLKPQGRLIANTQKISPMPVVTGAMLYPEGIAEQLQKICNEPLLVDALAPAEQCGTSRCVNMVLMGVLAKLLPFSDEDWAKAMEKSMKPQLLEMNKKAFAMGKEMRCTE